MRFILHKKHTIITPIPHGVEIGIAATRGTRRIFPEESASRTLRKRLLRFLERSGGTLFWGLCEGVCLYCTFHTLAHLIDISRGLSHDSFVSTFVWFFGGWLMMLLFLTAWGLMVIYRWIGTTTTTIVNDRITITKQIFGFPVEFPQHYALNQLTNVHMATDHHGLLVEYASHTMTWYPGIASPQAILLFQWLSGTARFHCHAIERIVFGAVPLPHDAPWTTLYNPDVAELRVPFLHLRHLVIATDTYDFYRLERFLTYAMNTLPQQYLKLHVEAQMYGDPEQLHPNLRNNLANLCKCVHVYQT